MVHLTDFICRVLPLVNIDKLDKLDFYLPAWVDKKDMPMVIWPVETADNGPAVIFYAVCTTTGITCVLMFLLLVVVFQRVAFVVAPRD